MVHDFILGNFIEYHLRQAGLQKNNVTTLSWCLCSPILICNLYKCLEKMRK